MAGFAAAFAVGFLAISIQFGFDAYGKMLTGLSGYSGTDATYSPFSMLTSVFRGICALFQVGASARCSGIYGNGDVRAFPGKLEKTKMAVYLCMLPVLLRFLWGRGMFNFQYAFYWSVFEWTMVLLYAAIGLCIWALADKRMFRRDKLLALLVLLVIAITPIGSNNETYRI